MTKPNNERGKPMPRRYEDPVIKEYIRLFLEDVSELIKPSSKRGKTLIRSIETILKKCRVTDYSAEDVILDSTVEGYDYIVRKSQKINNAYGWIQKIGSRKIYQQVRENIKREKTVARFEYSLRTSLSTQEEHATQDKNELLQSGIQQLSSSDQKLLEDRFFCGKSRDQVKEDYHSQGDYVSESALKKRESRAIRRLKDTLESQQ